MKFLFNLFKRKRPQFILRAPLHRNGVRVYEYYHPSPKEKYVPGTVFDIEDAWHFDYESEARAAIAYWIHLQSIGMDVESRKRYLANARRNIEIIQVK